MPELPDITVYVERLAARLVGSRLEQVRLRTPFLLRTVEPPVDAAHGRTVSEVARLGKRIRIGLDGDVHLVVHLMIAGRLQWRDPPAPEKLGRALAAFDFEPGTVLLTEAGSKRRASLHVVEGEAAVAALWRGGVEPLDASPEAFAAALMAERHTLKRALTDQRIVSGIGNTYSDEILHAARLSPFKHTTSLDEEEMRRLHAATTKVLTDWTERLREETGSGFPRKVTAFRDGMAVHGRYREACPDCGAPVQRVRHAEHEFNYCPGCQTGGRILADRSLSRLLGESWPRRLEDLE